MSDQQLLTRAHRRPSLDSVFAHRSNPISPHPDWHYNLRQSESSRKIRTHVKAFTKIVSETALDRNYPSKSTRTGSKSIDEALISSNLGCSRSCSPVPDLDLISISSCASLDETSSTVSFSSTSRRTIFNNFWFSNKSQSLPSFDSPVDSSIEVTDCPTIKSSDNKFGYENMLDECEEKGSKEGKHRKSTTKSPSHRSIFGADLISTSISTSMPELQKFSVRPDIRKTVSTSALLKRSGKCSSCLRSSCLRSPSGKCLQSELNKSVSFDPMVAIVVFIEPKERFAKDGWSKWFA
eukprot:CAMPEP_0198289750 /NCGR_PEP_ID=MMETSP1449-20131203/7838_1 /TAXON_ID=420275 /ORGANISM="Attheya septentrionalis, Strain CCMP2084" /LENGTH=293 /DNA_ID=CAMNT_0043988133 /DNA_START=210 /DNA_END=1091 /DNA_ORIENTATION=+